MLFVNALKFHSVFLLSDVRLVFFFSFGFKDKDFCFVSIAFPSI